MCGIYGQLRWNGAPIPADAAAGVDVLAHRGPDDRGVWSNGDVLLGARRLSIIDLQGGHQPIVNDDGSRVIAYNGELYNFRELRAELEAKGHRFRTRTDTEVVLRAYEQWGTEALTHFNGMFAFAIWDGRAGTLLLARDRIGEKPLYYYVDRERLVFASEIKAILADPSVPRDLDVRGLANYLAFGHSLAPQTIYRGVRKLLPGHVLLAGDRDVRVRRYWDVGDEPQLGEGEQLDEDGYAERIRELLDDSVQRRMVADVPVGAFLSGGVDSSAVVALMRRHATGPVKTFSLGFDVGGAYDEREDARGVAAFLGTEHHELRTEHVDLAGALESLVYHYDEPFADPAGFPVYLLSRFAREHVTVVLTGDGGDELFGGYRRYAADGMGSLYRRLPRVLTGTAIPGALERLPRLRRLKRAARTLPIHDAGRRYASWLAVFDEEMRAELLRPEVLGSLDGHDPAGAYPQHYAGLGEHLAADHLNRLMYVDLKTWLADDYMEKTDKATMASSLEARLPLLDHRLVELAFQIPGRYKIRGWSTKRIFKRAVRELVPPEVLRRPKHGFSVPIDPWFRGELRSFAAEVLLDGRTTRRGYFDARVVERLLREHADGRRVWDTHLWLLLNFELWHRRFLDGAGVSGPDATTATGSPSSRIEQGGPGHGLV
ncbi:MAG TPA: asparagine synthase (glutamine-hydrolyzing) [Actinomycetota bacterium]